MTAPNVVTYTFNELNLVIEIEVNMDAQEYMASDDKSYLGYAVKGGTATFKIGTDAYKATVAPQSLNPFDVLWEAPTSGNGGSQDGVDTSGIVFEGDNGYFSWDSAQNQFWFNHMPANQAVTLANVTNWPLSS